VRNPDTSLGPHGVVLRSGSDVEHVECFRSAAELARKIDVPTNRVTQILNGTPAITGDTALRLARFFGTSAQSWLNLQSLYDLRLAQEKAGKSIKLLPTLKRRELMRRKHFWNVYFAYRVGSFRWLSCPARCWRLLSTIRLLPSLRLKEVVARAVVCLQASLAHNFNLDPVIAERVASGATVAEGVLCV